MEIIIKLTLLVFAVLISANASTPRVKRQLYREQVLPFRGGKVPEDAFRADRLALNRLNKEGIAVPDGVLLEHRHPHSHPHSVRHDPEDENSVLRVVQQGDNRFVPDEGRYHNKMHLTVASTYIIRKPIEQQQTNIRPPEQQRPLHQFINYKQHSKNYHFDIHPLPQHRQPPAPQEQRYHVAYHQQHKHEPHTTAPPVYHIQPIPFELPNKEVMDERYFSKSGNPGTVVSAEAPLKFDWTFPTAHDGYTLDYNALLPFPSPEFHPSSYQFFETPETFTAYSNFFGHHSENLRYLRKTPESHAKGSRALTASTSTKAENKALPVRNGGSKSEKSKTA